MLRNYEPQKTTLPGRPSYCSSTLYQVSDIASKLGQKAGYASQGAAALGVAFGEPHIVAGAATADLISAGVQIAAGVGKWLAGDSTGIRTAVVGAITSATPAALIPKGLRNDMADIAIGYAVGAADPAAPNSKCTP